MRKNPPAIAVVGAVSTRYEGKHGGEAKVSADRRVDGSRKAHAASSRAANANGSQWIRTGMFIEAKV
jgi:hypothetical protein